MTNTKVTTQWVGPKLLIAEGHLIAPLGRCTGKVAIAELRFAVHGYKIPTCRLNVILGIDFLYESRAKIDVHKGMI